MKNIRFQIVVLIALIGTITNSFAQVVFVTIPVNDTIPSFQMAETETTNEQYKDFLNAAYVENLITYNDTTKIVYNLDGKQMIDLGGTRVIRDHNGDGQIVHEEMENPLNRCFIEFNTATNQFEVVDPAEVDWTIYFDTFIFPNAADGIEDWAELNDNNTGWYAYGDADMLLPTLEEVKECPVGFIRWYGANEFAKFYGYDLPTQAQWKVAAKAGQDFAFATSDGTVSESTAWYNNLGVGNRNRGHVQPVKSIPANPYGLYSMGGNTWEWCRDWFYPDPGNDFPLNNTDGYFFINDTLTDIRIDTSQPLSQANQYRKAGIGGSWNYFSLLMGTTRDGLTPFVETGNDHFGFRVVQNDIVNSTGNIYQEKEFQMFPNPTNNYVDINLSDANHTSLKIYSSLGQLVFSKGIDNSERIDVSQWNKGMYMVIVGNTIKKLIVQ